MFRYSLDDSNVISDYIISIGKVLRTFCNLQKLIENLHHGQNEAAIPNFGLCRIDLAPIYLFVVR